MGGPRQRQWVLATCEDEDRVHLELIGVPTCYVGLVEDRVHLEFGSQPENSKALTTYHVSWSLKRAAASLVQQGEV